jgi:hypothetical protein
LPNHLSLSFSESIAVILFYMGIITRSKSTALAATAAASSPTPPPINYIAVVVKAGETADASVLKSREVS